MNYKLHWNKHIQHIEYIEYISRMNFLNAILDVNWVPSFKIS